jgi:hypothetical protein
MFYTLDLAVLKNGTEFLLKSNVLVGATLVVDTSVVISAAGATIAATSVG